MKIFYSDTHLGHAPEFEVFDGGVRVPNFEVPERATRILAALKQTDWADVHAPADFGLDPIRAVHEKGYLNFLASAWTEWLAARPESDSAADKSALLPATFPPAGWRHRPEGLLGRAGYYMMDLSAPIVAGTYKAALASANCALSAAEAVSKGERAAFALCRPPGHHAGKANCGGYCYLNNAAIAANWLSSKGRVAVLDIDYHAGNGTQDIFYERADVLSISIHADPDFEYPHFSGYADERGAGAGLGFHHNFPLPAGTGDAAYFATLEIALGHIREFEPGYLVVSAGMDIYADDPLGKIKVTTKGIGEIGKRIASPGLPTTIIFEGGYNNDALARNVLALLEAFK
ncbi:MAG: histone deacetylase family protein [Chloroflexi bacterium]|nr:histone deacetylase family protein [Chloroflexota bacterium]